MTQVPLIPEMFTRTNVPDHSKTDVMQFEIDRTATPAKLCKQAAAVLSELLTLDGTKVTGLQIRELLENSTVLQTKQDPYRIFQYYLKQLPVTKVS